MNHSNERDLLDLYYDLKKFNDKITKHRERLNAMRYGDDEEAKRLAITLLENSMSSVPSIERNVEMVRHLYKSNTYKNKYLRVED